MYNVICFPHYTCGGLLADILNNTWSVVASNGGLESIHHNVGKVGDSNSIFETFTQTEFDSIITSAEQHNLPIGAWLGTHCWPGKISTNKFNTVINVTTCTSRSKIYRWVRTYYHYYVPGNVHIIDNLDRIDKFREGAKQYLSPFTPVVSDQIINIEFCEIVEKTANFCRIMEQYTSVLSLDKHIARWEQLNSFLYDADLWNSYPVARFHEAEYESLLNTDYIYL